MLQRIPLCVRGGVEVCVSLLVYKYEAIVKLCFFSNASFPYMLEQGLPQDLELADCLPCGPESTKSGFFLIWVWEIELKSYFCAESMLPLELHNLQIPEDI